MPDALKPEDLPNGIGAQTAKRMRSHRWGPPPPGQGRTEVCAACGIKRHQLDPRAPESCIGRVEGAPANATHDYDPFA